MLINTYFGPIHWIVPSTICLSGLLYPPAKQPMADPSCLCSEIKIVEEGDIFQYLLWWEGSMFLYVMWLSQLAFRHQIKRSCLTNQLFDHQMSKNRKCNAFLRYLNTNPIFVNQTIVIMQWQKEFTFNSTRSSSTEIEKWSIIIFTSEAFLFYLARLFSRKEASYS